MLLCEGKVIVELLRLTQSDSMFEEWVQSYGTVLDMGREICHGGGNPQRGMRRIFAALLLIGYSQDIWDFVSEELCDENMPLEEKRDPDSGKSFLYVYGHAAAPWTKVKFSQKYDKWGAL